MVIAQGTLDSTNATAKRWHRIDFNAPASGNHTVTVSWDSAADVRYKLRQTDRTAVTSTVRQPSPSVWNGALNTSTDYFIGVWSTNGIANYTVTIEPPAQP